MDNRKWHACI